MESLLLRSDNSLASLETMLTTANQVASDVATVTEDRGWSRIAHTGGRQVVTVIGSLDTLRTNTLGILADYWIDNAIRVFSRSAGIVLW